MKRNFKLYIMLLATSLFVACSTESTYCDLLDEKEQEGVVASMPELVDGTEQIVTRTSLIYDADAKKSLFSWQGGDQIGVFCSQDNGESGQQQFQTKSGSSGLWASFETLEGANAIVSPNVSYIAYRPYCSSLTDFTNYDVTYLDQTATANPQMANFYKATKASGLTDEEKAECMAAYKTSETNAASHLPAYDYLYSGAQQASEASVIHFQFNRAGVVTRFFLKSPAAIDYDSLALVIVGANDEPLTLTAKLDLTTALPGSITPVKKGKSQTLKFADNAYNMTTTSSDYYYNNIGYIVAYMMVAPVDFSDAKYTDAKLYVYLFGNSGSPATKKYYKSAPLNKPKLTPNMFYQWTSANQSEDTPIEFSEITIQDWEDDVLGNDNGKGTEGW